MAISQYFSRSDPRIQASLAQVEMGLCSDVPTLIGSEAMSAMGRQRPLRTLPFQGPLSGLKRKFELIFPQLKFEWPLLRVISTARCNTLTKTQKMACMLMNQRRRRGLYGGRESGAVGPLEASRGAEVDWASVWRTLIVCLSPVAAARGDRNSSRED